jgi:hypothetical protein
MMIVVEVVAGVADVVVLNVYQYQYQPRRRYHYHSETF